MLQVILNSNKHFLKIWSWGALHPMNVLGLGIFDRVGLPYTKICILNPKYPHFNVHLS